RARRLQCCQRMTTATRRVLGLRVAIGEAVEPESLERISVRLKSAVVALFSDRDRLDQRLT
ncbi:MAG TPA: hypothetical protein VFS68_00190, partial [Candidatus Udaeobacter sp.]|nr:hypothetical protein [Candidatus Udaeobacter sp.]